MWKGSLAMSVPFFALCVCACLVTSWYLKLKMLFTYLMNVERSTNSCLPKCSEESKDMNWKIYFLFSCWTCIFGCSAGTWSGKAESGLSSAMNDRRVQRCCVAKWPQCSKGRAGHWGALYPRWLWGEEVGRGDSTASFPVLCCCLPTTQLTCS